MGRHSRRGPAPKGDTADTTAVRGGRREAPPGQAPPGPGGMPPGAPAVQGPGRQPGRPPGGAHGAQGYAAAPYGTPQGAPAQGTPAHGTPGYGTPGGGVPRLPDGWLPDGTPAHGVPRLPDGTPAHGVPQAREGHPEQREPGGGWGEPTGRAAAGTGRGVPAGAGVSLPRQRQAPPGGPRQDYLDAFDEDDDLFTPRRSAPAPRPPASAHPTDPYAAATDWTTAPVAALPSDLHDDAPPTGEPAQTRGGKGKGRAFTGIAAAAVTTVLAVVVAGQVAGERDGAGVQAQSAPDRARDVRDSASRGDDRETPGGVSGAEPLTYEQKMDRKYPLSATLVGPGKFDAIPGIDKAPGKGQKITYRVDVEQGLGLDGELFAEAVQKTLNDNRSWAHNGARAFERIHSGRPDFVITLASPGTTAEWCAKSGLDTTVDNVSCDSAATERVMINAYRWAQGADTYGDEIHAYRQMLINHEIGHRLGYGHVTCDKNGDLAPVMQQQTKFVDRDGIDCRPNPWPYPKG
ncbi:DUF3152 domain-containing protein [Streptomyces sp.]|uniref:DUF3152 domain-containing protein n=1 Tax=Streptomyces sp. TaxID=1931 RepID=UPI002810BCA8|nr:DUF3152 domain-containing protein [Streptomyces sp.]